MRIELRAIVAAAAVCALIFSLLVAGAPHRMGDRVTLQNAHQGAGHVALCHDAARQSTSSPEPAKDGSGDQTGCPGCCLAALAVSTALPARVPILTRPLRAAEPIVYSAFAPSDFEASVLVAVNGARAPPSRNSIS
jgi:hypothetical protein